MNVTLIAENIALRLFQCEVEKSLDFPRNFPFFWGFQPMNSESLSQAFWRDKAFGNIKNLFQTAVI